MLEYLPSVFFAAMGVLGASLIWKGMRDLQKKGTMPNDPETMKKHFFYGMVGIVLCFLGGINVYVSWPSP